MPLPAAVVFDNDGLLLDTELAWTRAETLLFARRGRTFSDDHKRYLIGSARRAVEVKLEEMLERPAGEGAALMDELHDLVMEELLAGVEPRPGAVELLAALRDAGVPIGLASNSPRAFVERALAQSPVDRDLFAVTLAGDEVLSPKPAPDIYLAACEALGAAPGACVALEDSPSGVRAADAAGMMVVGVPYLAGIDLPEATLVARSLSDDDVWRALGL